MVRSDADDMLSSRAKLFFEGNDFIGYASGQILIILSVSKSMMYCIRTLDSGYTSIRFINKKSNLTGRKL